MNPTQNGLNATANPATGTLEISLIKNGEMAGMIEIDMKEASSIAAAVLMAAKTGFEMTGKEPPEQVAPEAYSNLPPSGLNLGPSHIPDCDSLIFYFGETALGISIPRSLATEVGQRLVTLGATGRAQ